MGPMIWARHPTMTCAKNYAIVSEASQLPLQPTYQSEEDLDGRQKDESATKIVLVNDDFDRDLAKTGAQHDRYQEADLPCQKA